MRLNKSYLLLLTIGFVFGNLSAQDTLKPKLPDTTVQVSADTTQMDTLKADTIHLIDDLPSTNDSIQLPSKLSSLNKLNDSIQKTTYFNGHKLIQDSPIVENLDSLAYVKYYEKEYLILDTNLRKQSAQTYSSVIPTFPDSVYAKRIAALNIETPFEFVYNKQVKAFIDLYAIRKRRLTEKVLGLAKIYFPMIEEELDKYNLPLEIKYLAVVESALNPAAGSPKGAKGLWQFMYGTGKVYGLKVSSMVDDRYDPYKSTVAACKHLKDLYDIYGQWSLALAAYNSGVGNVNRAIRRAGGTKNYWAIWPYLPRETRGYVPAFIAVNYIMHYAAEHNLHAMTPGIFFYDIDTVTVHNVLSFDQLHEMLGIPADELKFLNPEFKMGIIPAVDGRTYTLRIPRQFTDEFLNNEDALYAFKTKEGIAHDKLMAEIKKAGNRQIHIVRSGENLGSIARKYHVYVRQLKSWNRLRNSRIYVGQKLVLFGSAENPFANESEPISRSKNKTTHIIQKGENLGLLAKRYKCSITDLKEWNGLKNNIIYPGQKIYVYKPNDKVVATLKDKKYIYHIVKPGDTLWDIAQEYDGVTVAQIKKLNRIHNAQKLRPGQKIKIATVS
ncbi:MAG: LysM peptidoglycan-binding domain-containing protein [Bacteroidales bacterium]|nr:LysM peptidoglycan-binding domain-containing protein [Bacteroidales bacterium]